MKALIVEDNVVLAQIVGEYVSDIFSDVIIVNDGRSALEELKKSQFEFVFTDLKIPEMTGDVLLEKMQETSNNLAHVVVASGTYNLEIKEKLKLMHRGPIYFLPKPYTEEKLKTYFESIQLSLAKQKAS